MGAPCCRGAGLSADRSRHLLDTSILLSVRTGLSAAPATAVSIVSLGELRAGVLLARSDVEREQRRRLLEDVRATFLGLPVDELVAEQYGEVLAVARHQRRITTATDLLIIATARAHRRILRTADERQARLAEAADVAVVAG